MYHVIHLTETDGDVHIESCDSVKEMMDYIKEKGLYTEEYTIIDGKIVETAEDLSV